MRKNGQKVIQTFQPNEFSYDIVLYKKRIVKKKKNFCCNDIAIFKSPLCFDFIFDLGKLSPYFALVLTYQDTLLMSKQTKKSPTMLGQILLCHKKDEDLVHVLCQSILQSCPGLKNSLKVVGADGEKSISKVVCSSFPGSILLLCHKHMEENIERHLSDFTEAKKKMIMTQIFGNSYTYGFVDSMAMEEFAERMNALNTEWEIGGAEMVEFNEYFRKYKEDEFKYHVMKGTVNVAEITGTTYGYYPFLLILHFKVHHKGLKFVEGISQKEIF